VTGPTGSGKSTTLAAMIDYINKNEYGHILTVEDPIEFVHTSQKCLINQREVHRDTHGFNEALRSALREDRTSSWWANFVTWKPSAWH
jgi:twitching motility protein PilT